MPSPDGRPVFIPRVPWHTVKEYKDIPEVESSFRLYDASDPEASGDARDERGNYLREHPDEP